MVPPLAGFIAVDMNLLVRQLADYGSFHIIILVYQLNNIASLSAGTAFARV